MKFHIDTDGSRYGKLVPGLILVGIGLLALFGNLGIHLFGNVLGVLLFGGLAYYLYSEGKRTGRAGMRLAALPLAGLALAALLPGSVGGALFLALIGLAFALVWRTDRSHWWAIIPAGTLGSLAATAALGSLFGAASGFVFLMGLAATFYALTRLEVAPQSWAIFPAGGLAVIAVLTLVGAGGWLLPLALIVGGLVMLVRSGVVGRGPVFVRPAGTGEMVASQPDRTGPPAPVAPAAPPVRVNEPADELGAGQDDRTA